ncbi:MAG: hypothetical protein JNN17_13775 [Verrucomicrobiaceae bacterium]|nr:hypothetical protein [Verrucomicrobiaceae bacterium]
MNAQIIQRGAKKEFAVIPYRDFLKIQEELEDYHDILAIRKAKAESAGKKRRSFFEVAKELGWGQQKAKRV